MHRCSCCCVVLKNSLSTGVVFLRCAQNSPSTGVDLVLLCTRIVFLRWCAQEWS